MYNKLLNCLDCVRRRTDFVPKVADRKSVV